MESHESVAVVLVDISGTIQYWSTGATLLFGHANSVGQTLDVIVPEEFREQHWSGFRLAMETGVSEESGGRFNIPVRCSDDKVRSFPGTFSVLWDGRGAAVGGVGTWTRRRGDEEPFTPVAPL
ncbi:PAS domain-containing protein [Nocardia sp. NBC_01499]|uniref:PAS domain-containing protein n=1 Tax=Nocardia sp. NBC_01499 TaxID=2903597 RepID=UPI00386D3B06